MINAKGDMPTDQIPSELQPDAQMINTILSDPSLESGIIDPEDKNIATVLKSLEKLQTSKYAEQPSVKKLIEGTHERLEELLLGGIPM